MTDEMLQTESPNFPHTLAQWLYLLIATFLGGGGLGAWLTAWYRRKHGPAEVRKLDAETRSIIIRDDIALGDSVSRLIKEVAQAAVDAEERRDSWERREEELRTQIRFWRNKAEELDGELIDSRDANALLQARLRNKTDSLDKAMGLLQVHRIPYGEFDQPKE